MPPRQRRASPPRRIGRFPALSVLLVASALAGLAVAGESAATVDAATVDTSAVLTTPPEPTPTPSPVAPDLVDRAWPKNPPWDACPRPVWPGLLSEGSPGAGRRVLVIGDSLTRESRVPTAKALRRSGWTPTFRCWGSKRLDWGLAQVARAKKLNQLPEFVVIALGTNDASWEPLTTTERRVRQLLDRVGPKRQVIWVDLDVDYSSYSHRRAQWINGMIRRVAANRANVTVLPWRRIARAERAGRFDGIHYFHDGYKLRGRTVAAALDKVGRRVPAATPQAAPTATPQAAPSAAPTPSATVPTPQNGIGPTSP